ncbi:MAG: Fe-S oxidoreductase [Planctomycetaceae bacterium]|nr:MAG: Fe-S oxidoreductase [Planctomycetaceae bacterium]
MQVALFVPCYIDQFYPQVAWAACELLERYGCQVAFPEEQTCCGQPLANTGCFTEASRLATRFLGVFEGYEYIVCPSGSCTAMVRQHYPDVLGEHPQCHHVGRRTYELCEFLHDVLGVRAMEGRFPHRVGLHQSCHGLRELRLGPSSEMRTPRVNKVARLLQSLQGLELVPLKRPDECCGFGGTFAVAEEAVSCQMGRDRLHDHQQAGAEIITAADMSCLMHLEGLIRRDRIPLRVMHVAEILAGYDPPPA